MVLVLVMVVRIEAQTTRCCCAAMPALPVAVLRGPPHNRALMSPVVQATHELGPVGPASQLLSWLACCSLVSW